ncbi:MAG: dual specificity protein phosphatase family protein [Nitrospiria bacterium]
MPEPVSFTKSPSKFIKKICIFLLLLLISLPLSSCETVKHLIYTYDPLNFHVVKEGVLYRSAQPSGRDLQRVVEQYKIKSIINLRGAQPGKSWYDIEKKASDKLGLERVDIWMSAGRLPHRDDLIRLLDAYKELPRPILIHCKAGADRTGEAAAMFALDHLGWSKREAAGQLSPFYGHFPDFQPSKTYFMREVYQGEAWARNAYRPCQENYKHYKKGLYCGIEDSLRPFVLEFDDEQ